jgi:hypothetical protein
MKTAFKATFVAGALAVSAAGSAFAIDVTVTFDPGTVGHGCTDGFWTTKRE